MAQTKSPTPWINQFDLSSAWGFVYRITNIKTNRIYIGKKQLFFKRAKKIIPSDWLTYKSSCKVLVEEISLNAQDFIFEIIAIAYSKNELNYLELKHQILEGVLERDSYNGWIKVTCRKLKK